MTFSVTILGNSAALPTRNHHTTAQVVTYHNQLFLLDCGEGTQNQIRDLGIKVSRVSHIFISHLHGDHYYGILGLITTLHLQRRTQPLTIISPSGLKEIIQLNLLASGTELSYELLFIEIHPHTEILYEDEFLCVTPIPMIHRIPCYGYLFTEKKGRVNVKSEALNEYKIPIEEISSIKAGGGFKTTSGIIVPHEKLVIKRPQRKYAFCSDTIFSDSYLKRIMHVDLLYHESTFLKQDADKAKDRFHCTSEQAAIVAREVGAKKLLLGHFSSRYASEELFENEARHIFPNSYSSIEGETYGIE